MYMTPRMRYNLVRYGNIMSLDSQKRQYNRHGWPYIGPVIKTNENKVAVTCEAIVTSENVDTNVWVLKSMQSIEKRWSPSKLYIVYDYGLLLSLILIRRCPRHTLSRAGGYTQEQKKNKHPYATTYDQDHQNNTDVQDHSRSNSHPHQTMYHPSSCHHNKGHWRPHHAKKGKEGNANA